MVMVMVMVMVMIWYGMVYIFESLFAIECISRYIYKKEEYICMVHHVYKVYDTI